MFSQQLQDTLPNSLEIENSYHIVEGNVYDAVSMKDFKKVCSNFLFYNGYYPAENSSLISFI